MEDRRDPVAQAGAEFHEGATRRRQQAHDLRRKCHIGFVAIGAGEQRFGGFMVAHLRHQSSALGGGDIGRIGNNQVESRRHGLAPGGSAKMRPMGNAMARRVAPRDAQCGKAPVDTETFGARQFAQQRNQQTTAAGAEIEDIQKSFLIKKGTLIQFYDFEQIVKAYTTPFDFY